MTFLQCIISGVVLLPLLTWTRGTSANPTDARPTASPDELDVSYWHGLAQSDLQKALNYERNVNVARNVIVFLGDGMSITTVTAARIYKGQLKGKTGEEEKLAFEDFPGLGLSKTYNTDAQIPDSAGTATAFLCGTKAAYGTLGVGPRVPRGNCSLSKTNNLTCLAGQAQKEGKVAGFVTTSRITHATPAAFYAYSADRDWEDDSELSAEAQEQGCPDIAAQLLEEPARDFRVIMGGGRRHLYPATTTDPEYPDRRGRRADGRNIVDEWMTEKRSRDFRPSYVWNKTEFDAVDATKSDYLLGLFEYSHMQYDGERADDKAGEPSLADMTGKAIDILNKNKEGYVLLVEGARIDHAHHGNVATKSLEDTLSFDAAIQRALNMVDLEETLIIVTADHGHGLAMTSYSRRGNPIIGLAHYSDTIYKSELSDLDNMTFTTLSYSTGPGYTPRTNLTKEEVVADGYMQASTVPLKSASHDGTDVAIYATGPMSHLFHTTHEQHYVFHVAAFASCLGDNKGHCSGRTSGGAITSSSATKMAAVRSAGSLLLLALVVCY